MYKQVDDFRKVFAAVAHARDLRADTFQMLHAFFDTLFTAYPTVTSKSDGLLIGTVSGNNDANGACLCIDIHKKNEEDGILNDGLRGTVRIYISAGNHVTFSFDDREVYNRERYPTEEVKNNQQNATKAAADAVAFHIDSWSPERAAAKIIGTVRDLGHPFLKDYFLTFDGKTPEETIAQLSKNQPAGMTPA